jgi:outer membrane protein assembly factor BamB
MQKIMLVGLLLLFVGVEFSQAQTQVELLDDASVHGGLIVQVGVEDVDALIAFGRREGCLVQAIDADPARVQKAREAVAAEGLYGKVSIERLEGDALPYIDNLVNLLIVEPGESIPNDEIVRVLCPNGVAYIMSKRGEPTRFVKPRPEEIDEWTHYLHSPDNNAVANDTVVNSPRRLQWDGGPRWTRSHEKMSSMNAMVSAGGRVFYIMDEGPTSSVQLPPEWKLVARDAFNGVVLWKRDIPRWQTHLWPLKAGPATVPRRLVAVGDRVYVTLGLTEPAVALDASTGETVTTYSGTEGTEEILVKDGVVYVRVNEDYKPDVYQPENEHCWTESARAMSVLGAWKPSERQYVAAIDANSGDELWRVDSPIGRLTLTVDADSVFFHSGEAIVCLDRSSGEERWSKADVPQFATLTTRMPPTLVSYEEVLIYQHQANIKAYSRESGQLLWGSKHPRSGHVSPGDALVINGLVWSAGMGKQPFVGKNVRTGEVEASFLPPDMTWFHPRCHRSKGTCQFLLTSRTGIEVVDVQEEVVDVNHWTRGACVYGIMPANGLIYAGPHSCACLLETKTSGFNALAPARDASNPSPTTPDAERLTLGPAFNDVGSNNTASIGVDSWPMYRHDPARSGATTTSVSLVPERLWETDAGDGTSSPVTADELMFTVMPDAHEVRAASLAGGKTQWTHIAGGRIDSPPTIADGRVYFGSRDGCVYCLRASDGTLAWKFLAAENARQLVSYGQLESVWPVHGSVLVMNNAVHFVAGRSAFLDDGLRSYKLDARTGALLAMHEIDETTPDSGENLQELQGGWLGLTMPVANPDILSSDGERIYMRSEPFDLDGKRLRVAPDLDVASQNRDGAHLFSPVGLLDGDWHHRSYWMYGVTSVYGWHVWFDAAKYAPAGRILCFDENEIFGFARKPQFLAQSPTIEYQLYKADKRPDVGGAERVREVASEHTDREWNQTQWLSRGEVYEPSQLTALNYHWRLEDLPFQVRAMVLTENAICVAGPPDVLDEVALWRNPSDPSHQSALREQAEALAGLQGGTLQILDRENGRTLASVDLESPPIFDGMIAVDGKLLLTLMNGKVVCYGGVRLNE